MRDFLIVIFALAAVLALFYLRVKRAGGWLPLRKQKIQKLFPEDDQD
jgi:hypothetical protein